MARPFLFTALGRRNKGESGQQRDCLPYRGKHDRVEETLRKLKSSIGTCHIVAVDGFQCGSGSHGEVVRQAVDYLRNVVRVERGGSQVPNAWAA